MIYGKFRLCGGICRAIAISVANTTRHCLTSLLRPREGVKYIEYTITSAAETSFSEVAGKRLSQKQATTETFQ
jgi:hypothetical protein